MSDSPEELLAQHEEYVGSAVQKFEWVVSFMAIKDRFCFEILSMMKKIPSTSMTTMGVAIVNNRLQLVYNPEFMHSLSKEELRYVLGHEVLHVVLHHITRRLPLDRREHLLYNVAMDLAINSLLPDDSDRYAPRYKADTFDKKGKLIAKKGDMAILRPEQPQFRMEPRLSTELYVKLLREKADSKSGFLDELEEAAEAGAGDVHQGWGPNDLIDEKIKQRIEHIEKNNLWGNVSESFKEVVRSAQTAQIPWRRHLRHAFGQILHHTLRPTFKRPDRRFGYPYSGKVRDSLGKVLVGWDTSGSVPTKDIEQMLTETNKLSTSMPVDLMLFDCNLQWEKAVPWDKRRTTCGISGRGGTNFQALIDYSDKHGYTSLVIFTDGYASEPTIPKAKNVIWVITPGGVRPAPWGKLVQIVSKEEL
jgi:predicted metal-dependent peptidase